MVRERGGTRRQSGYPAARQWQESRCCHVLTVEMNFAWGGDRRAGWGGFTSATCVVAATCTSWLTVLSHPCMEKSRNQKGLRSLSEGVTGHQENGHDHSEKKGEITGKELALNTNWQVTTKPRVNPFKA